MMRLIRALTGRSRREAAARDEMDQYRADHAVAMQAIQLKAAALKTGAERIVREGRKTEEAAAELMARLREDLE